MSFKYSSHFNLILASESPRRQELIKLLEIPFSIKPHAFEEIGRGDWSPEEEVIQFSRRKALSLREEYPQALILGSDTLVELSGKKMGKPKNAEEAFKMLTELSGTNHCVLTGLSLLDSATGEIKESVCRTQIKFRVLKPEEVKAYVNTGEPMGKAGAYAIQGEGGGFVASMEGDYFNVVGLPLRDLVHLLAKFGVEVPVSVDEIYAKSSP